MTAEHINPYAPPTAELIVAPEADDSTPLYFPVSPTKFVVMSLCTWSLYEVYWFYKNWKMVRDREQSDIYPIWRAIFGVFFCYPLFKHIHQGESELGNASFQAGLMASCWIVFTLFTRLPEPADMMSLFAFVFMLPPVRAIQRINASVAPQHDRNDRFTAWNWFGIVVGGLLLILVILDMLGLGM